MRVVGKYSVNNNLFELILFNYLNKYFFQCKKGFHIFRKSIQVGQVLQLTVVLTLYFIKTCWSEQKLKSENEYNLSDICLCYELEAQIFDFLIRKEKSVREYCIWRRKIHIER